MGSRGSTSVFGRGCGVCPSLGGGKDWLQTGKRTELGTESQRG